MVYYLYADFTRKTTTFLHVLIVCFFSEQPNLTIYGISISSHIEDVTFDVPWMAGYTSYICYNDQGYLCFSKQNLPRVACWKTYLIQFPSIHSCRHFPSRHIASETIYVYNKHSQRHAIPTVAISQSKSLLNDKSLMGCLNDSAWMDAVCTFVSSLG